MSRQTCSAGLLLLMTLGCGGTARPFSNTWVVDPASGITGGLDLYSVAIDQNASLGFAVGETSFHRAIYVDVKATKISRRVLRDPASNDPTNVLQTSVLIRF